MMSWVPNVRKRLIQHIQNKTAEKTTNHIHRIRPLDVYNSLQRDKVARQAPTFLLPSALLCKNHVASGTLNDGTPVTVYRENTTTGAVRAYVNRCRHRGALLVNTSPTTPQSLASAALTCPYHAWTYDARNGSLKGVPSRKQAFPCLEKSNYGLIPVHCFETAGGIWAVGGKETHDDNGNNSSMWEQINTELMPFFSEATSSNSNNSSTLVGYREWTLKANWQLLVETFLEAYHVHSLHHNTLGKVAHANVFMITDQLGDNKRSLRMTVPLKNFDATPTSEEDDDDESLFFGQTSTTYLLFPCTAIALFKRFILFISIQPFTKNNKSSSTAGSNSSRVRAWGMSRIDSGGGDDDTNNNCYRDFQSVIRGIEEDWECAEGIQKGLLLSLNGDDEDTIFSYGCYEGNNVAFLENVRLVAEQLSNNDNNKDDS